MQSTGTSGIHFAPIFREAELFSLCMKSEEAKKGITDATREEEARMIAYRQTAKKDMQLFLERCSRAGYEKYWRKAACLTEDISFEQMADTRYLTEAERPVFQKARQLARDYNRETFEKMRALNMPATTRIADQSKRFRFEYDKNDLELLNKKISWGQYNTRRKEIVYEARQAATSD